MAKPEWHYSFLNEFDVVKTTGLRMKRVITYFKVYEQKEGYTVRGIVRPYLQYWEIN